MYAATIVLITATYVLLWSITWTALLAKLQCRQPFVSSSRYREELGLSMLLALLPPMWVVAPFVTGFYEHGFQVLPRSRECAKSPWSWPIPILTNRRLAARVQELESALLPFVPTTDLSFLGEDNVGVLEFYSGENSRYVFPGITVKSLMTAARTMGRSY